MIVSTSAGSSASGRHRSVTTETPKAGSRACTAVITSGTVDMPTTSAPICRRKRYSARVSRFGPAMATRTPLWQAKFSRRAVSSATSPSRCTYGSDMSGNRGPRSSWLMPMRGLSPIRLMWSSMTIRSPRA